MRKAKKFKTFFFVNLQVKCFLIFEIYNNILNYLYKISFYPNLSPREKSMCEPLNINKKTSNYTKKKIKNKKYLY